MNPNQSSLRLPVNQLLHLDSSTSGAEASSSNSPEESTSKIPQQGFRGLVGAEVSARLDVDGFYTLHNYDHFPVCKPASTMSVTFYRFAQFIDEVFQASLEEMEIRYGPGRLVGSIFVSTNELGRGSNGTIVFEGYLRETENSVGTRMVKVEPMTIAVKQLLFSHHKSARNEIETLIKCFHENVVRYYRIEEEMGIFIYVALERCSSSLDDLIGAQSPFMKVNVVNPTQEDLQLRSKEDWKLWCQWDKKWRPTPELIKIIAHIIAGLKHLHGKNIAHRDLKPHNVLIKRENELQAKIADMVLSKELDEAAVPLDKLTSYTAGSLGWQAPEKLMIERRCKLKGKGYLAADMFSLGCVLYCCITGGKHPFGSEPLDRATNIRKGIRENMAVEHESMCPETTDLVESLLDDDPDKRPRAQDVFNHHFFWSAKERLEFLDKANDKLMGELKKCPIGNIIKDVFIARFPTSSLN